jgi:serine/threonine protein kinase
MVDVTSKNTTSRVAKAKATVKLSSEVFNLISKVNSKHEIYSKIVVADYMVPPHVSEGAAHFLSCALRVNAEKRYTAGELYLHGWVQLQDEDAMGILEWEKKRDTDEEANRTERLKNRCPRLSWDQKLAAEREEKVVPGEKENYAQENSR